MRPDGNERWLTFGLGTKQSHAIGQTSGESTAVASTPTSRSISSRLDFAALQFHNLLPRFPLSARQPLSLPSAPLFRAVVPGETYAEAAEKLSVKGAAPCQAVEQCLVRGQHEGPGHHRELPRQDVAVEDLKIPRRAGDRNVHSARTLFRISARVAKIQPKPT